MLRLVGVDQLMPQVVGHLADLVAGRAALIVATSKV
jgi:hypothetical protein